MSEHLSDKQRLFPGPIETLERPARDSESTYMYLNRAAGAQYDRIRELVERWYQNYPADHRDDLRRRIQSSNTSAQLSSVFFELYLHELLVRLGYEITIHPDLLPATSKRPEFLVKHASGEQFILEAIAATDVSRVEAAQQARIGRLYDTINSKLDSPDCFLSIQVLKSSKSPLAGTRLLAFLRERLTDIDVDKLAESFSRRGFAELPKWVYAENGWSIRCFPVPKSSALRGKEGVRPLAFFPQPVQMVEPRDAVLKAVKKKASRYKELGMPYIVAVNALGLFVDHIAIMEALFGKEVITYSTLNGEMEGAPQLQRRPDGSLFYKGSPINTRVSGVLIAYDVAPWNVGRSDAILYHNPWARFPYIGRLCKLRDYVGNGETMELQPGIHPRDIFGLGPQWPANDGAE